MRAIKKLVTLTLALTLLIALCKPKRITQPLLEPKELPEIPMFIRDIDAADYSGISLTRWDVEASAIEPRTPKAYTVMIYMNGSDLESEGGAATADLLEIAYSGVDTEKVNVVVFTGGTYRWHTDAIPPFECALWYLEDGVFTGLAELGLLNMGDSGTLSSFVDFSTRYFPAERYGLILWDHGGGSVAGYGHDEVWDGNGLSLLEIAFALKSSGLERLAFLGFDACLMATVETAVIAADFADYLIGSQDVEPEDGWDYRFLSALNGEAGADTETLGFEIADCYMEHYGSGADESLTISVIDLRYAHDVMGALGALTRRCSQNLREEIWTERFAEKRGKTKSFGGGSLRDNDCDMVDIGDMAANLADLYPHEAEAVMLALENAVIYNRHNSETDLCGLTAYYIYGGYGDAEFLLETYAALRMSREYTEYLTEFVDVLKREVNGGAPSGERVVRDGVIDGVRVEMYEVSRWRDGSKFAVPIRYNDCDADLMILVNEENPDGKIIGVRREEGYVIQKGEKGISDGDRILLLT